ncbi:MAG: hypothetical protein PVI50_07310 [Gammaproteobacteria bacterium]
MAGERYYRTRIADHEHGSLAGPRPARAVHRRGCLPGLLLLALLPAGAHTETATMPDPRIEEASALMHAFAARTGLTSAQPARRYLWTDAFAVCNDLGLARVTGDPAYTARARALVGQVHRTLGRHRADDRRTGWISGLDEAAGAAHPTRGGLRIGKELPERRPGEPIDERLEWERDGQYFHYLTRWMHALDQLTRSTREPQFTGWARELAQTAFDAFVYRRAARDPWRMAWKMSIDLKRVLVSSMGQHDPLDGYISNLQLLSTARTLPGPDGGPDLHEATQVYATMLQHSAWTTADPLGIGGLLVDAWRVQQLAQQGAVPQAQLVERLLESALAGLRHYVQAGELTRPAGHRLAFRELGLAIGLHAAERLQHAAGQEAYPPRLRTLIETLMSFLPVRDAIETFWREPAHQRTDTWREHEDINAVMLATSLVPGGYLDLPPL